MDTLFLWRPQHFFAGAKYRRCPTLLIAGSDCDWEKREVSMDRERRRAGLIPALCTPIYSHPSAPLTTSLRA